MERRLLVVLAAIAVAVVAVGLSAAATTSRNDSAQPTRDVQRMKPAKKTADRTPARSADAPVTTSSGNPQTVEEVRSYWTKERMEDAQPMEKTRQGGSRTSSPAPTGITVPGSAPSKATTSRTSRAKSPKSQSAGQTGVVTSPAVSNPNYWTDDAMADAQPMDNTRPGGTGSQGEPDPGGTTVPGSPPP